MWPPNEPGWALAGLLVLAWLWGSFLNQCVDRLPRTVRWGPPTAQARPPGISGGPPAARAVTMLRPARSVCLSCARSIPWYENIPVASYLLLRGRCRACGAAIGLRTLVVEAATPLLFGLIFVAWRAAGAAPTWLAWHLAAASWGLLFVPMCIEQRKNPRTAVCLAGTAGIALIAWGATVAFL